MFMLLDAHVKRTCIKWEACADFEIFLFLKHSRGGFRMELKASADQPAGLQLFPFKNGTMGGFRCSAHAGLPAFVFLV